MTVQGSPAPAKSPMVKGTPGPDLKENHSRMDEGADEENMADVVKTPTAGQQFITPTSHVSH